VENFGRLYGSNQPISAHFTAFNSSDQLQRKRSSIFQEALRNCRQAGFVIQLAVGEAIGVLANAQDQKWGGLSALEPNFAPVFCILTLEGSH